MAPMCAYLNSVNTILYCAQWKETVGFYRDLLRFPIVFSTDWFVEFELTETARLSIADQRRATVKSVRGNGITLSLEVTNIQAVWENVFKAGLKPTDISVHAWDAHVFYLSDPEGHRLEFWQPARAL